MRSVADLVRYEDRWCYVTLRLPKQLWDRYEESFSEWPHAIGLMRDTCLVTMCRRVYGSDDPQ